MEANIHSLYQKVSKGNLVISHEGAIDSDLISTFLAKVEDSLLQDGENAKKVRKIYNILVEALQNLYHHQEIPPKAFLDSMQIPGLSQYVFFAMTKENNGNYRVTCGNFVLKSKVKVLRDRMEQLNSLSQEELKELYKIILNNDEFSEKGGGGLGFIDMARKSGNKFGYEFINFDDKFNFFIFEVLVS